MDDFLMKFGSRLDAIDIHIAKINTSLFGANNNNGMSRVVSELSEKIDTNRNDLYNSLENVKKQNIELQKTVASLVASVATMKWVIGVGLSLVGVALAIVRML